MLNGLDLFSGIGGIAIALGEWVRPVAYVEIDPYCQRVLAARMQDGRLPAAPIWDDVRTFDGSALRGVVDVISGGFPCQDISVAGRGEGVEGERSGLFFEIVRLAEEIEPTFLFLENVPAIRTRGLSVVARELASLRYDLRWGTLSAFDVGSPHKRDRWWLCAHAVRKRRQGASKRDRKGPAIIGARGRDAHGLRDAVSDALGAVLRDERRGGHGPEGESEAEPRVDGEAQSVADAVREGSQDAGALEQPGRISPFAARSWWGAEPDVGRVAHGVRSRVDRLRALGNAVVPAQAREAFRRLTGL